VDGDVITGASLVGGGSGWGGSGGGGGVVAGAETGED